MLGRCENIMDFFVSHESFRFASLGPVAIEDVDSVAGFSTWSFTVTFTTIFIYNNIYSYPVYEFEFHTRLLKSGYGYRTDLRVSEHCLGCFLALSHDIA